jgi:predicted CXXCH cytochrome family protein
VAYAQCIDCHRDRHDGQFTKRADKGDCGSCHTLNSFERSTFDVKAHVATKYPLTGKHAEVACVNCHRKTGPATNYHPKFEACIDCHQDTHKRQFVARYSNQCETCHTTSNFTPATFTLARHRETRFDLTGAHRAAACTDCHKQSGPGEAHQYLFENRSCVACHRDPHELDAQQNQCEACHTLSAWSPALAFDHNKTRFPLVGSHRVVGCFSCHKPEATTAGKLIRFKGASQECSGCHEDIHRGQFTSRQDTSRCAVCHSTLKWLPASGFDHSMTAFSLDGAHQNVRCVLCHATTVRAAGRQVVQY